MCELTVWGCLCGLISDLALPDQKTPPPPSVLHVFSGKIEMHVAAAIIFAEILSCLKAKTNVPFFPGHPVSKFALGHSSLAANCMYKYAVGQTARLVVPSHSATTYVI
uniref:Uncharacterized protein n=1 Tax=Eutreptiella gymnastica TaxID=73025 RepID=A0A7S4FLC3_9EUGL